MKSIPRIVIVNYNGAAFVREAVESALRQTLECETVVVDNASTDASLAFLRHASGIRLIENDRNDGFGAAANIGAFAKTGNEPEYVAFLNPDAIAEPLWLERTITWMRRGRIDFASTVVAGATSPFFAGGTWLPWLGAARTLHEPSVDEPDWLSGCALVVQIDALRALGGFDDRYFLYFEDVDLSLRARRAGYSLGVFREVLVSHERDGGSTNQLGSRRKAALAFCSKGKLARRFLGPVHLAVALPFQLLLSPAVNGVPPRYWLATARAFLSGFRIKPDNSAK